MAKRHETAETTTIDHDTTMPPVESAAVEQPEADISEDRAVVAVPMAGVLAGKFAIKKRVTLPLFRIEATPSVLRFESDWYQGKVIESENRAAPIMARVTDMMTGEEGEVIAGTVLVSELSRSYPRIMPDGSKVFEYGKNADQDAASKPGHLGLTFAVSRSQPEGKRKYSLFHIAEVEAV